MNEKQIFKNDLLKNCLYMDDILLSEMKYKVIKKRSKKAYCVDLSIKKTT